MTPIEEVRELLSERELAVAGGVSLVGLVGMGLAGGRRPLFVLGLALAAVGGTTFGEKACICAAAALIDHFSGDAPLARLPDVGWAAVAVGSAYLCTPDTERAIALLAVVAVGAALAVAMAWPWAAVTTGVSVALVWIALTDASARSSAAVATIGIAGVHELVALSLRDEGRVRARAIIVVLGGLATVALARGAGLEPGFAPAVWRTAGIVGLVAVALALSRAANRGALRSAG